MSHYLKSTGINPSINAQARQIPRVGGINERDRVGGGTLGYLK